jgi:hypothetical protein
LASPTGKEARKRNGSILRVISADRSRCPNSLMRVFGHYGIKALELVCEPDYLQTKFVASSIEPEPTYFGTFG